MTASIIDKLGSVLENGCWMSSKESLVNTVEPWLGSPIQPLPSSQRRYQNHIRDTFSSAQPSGHRQTSNAAENSLFMADRARMSCDEVCGRINRVFELHRRAELALTKRVSSQTQPNPTSPAKRCRSSNFVAVLGGWSSLDGRVQIPSQRLL